MTPLTLKYLSKRGSPSEKEKEGPSKKNTGVIKRIEKAFERQVALLHENSAGLLTKEKNLLYDYKEKQEELELQNRAT